MIKLTKKMREVLENADLERGEINNVPMSTMYGFEARKLVSTDWRRGTTSVQSLHQGGTFPIFSRVKLTSAGLRAVRSLKGLTTHVQDDDHPTSVSTPQWIAPRPARGAR